MIAVFVGWFSDFVNEEFVSDLRQLLISAISFVLFELLRSWREKRIKKRSDNGNK